MQILVYLHPHVPVIVQIRPTHHSLRPLSSSTCLCRVFRATHSFRLGDFLPLCADNLMDPWLEQVKAQSP